MAAIFNPTVSDIIDCTINFDVSGFEVEGYWDDPRFGASYEITAEHISAENFFAIKETAYPANKLDYSLSITFE